MVGNGAAEIRVVENGAEIRVVENGAAEIKDPVHKFIIIN